MLHRLFAALSVFAVLATAQPAAAQETIPTQAQWAAAKKTVELPNGQTLAYVDIGNPKGKPTLLIHGYTDNSRSWSLMAPYLSERRLLAIDLRGHGKSEAPDCCYGFLDFANDASLFLDAMGVEKADVIGHSLGSLTGQVLAAQHPEKIDKLVLISSTIAANSGPGSWLWDNISTLQPPIDPDGKFMKDWYWNPNPVDEDYISRERAESAAVPIHVWKGVLWGTMIHNLSAMTPLIKAPVLILWGDQDSLFDAASQDKLKAAFPQAQYETFVGAGHNMFWEFPERAASVIETFLDE